MDINLASLMSCPIYFKMFVITAEVGFKRKLVNQIAKYLISVGNQKTEHGGVKHIE